MSDTQAYRFRTEVETRFRDLDALRHVNHAVYLTLLEEARIRYFVEVLELAVPKGLDDWVLADIRCKYLAPLRYGERLAIGIRVEWMRNSSFGATYEMVSLTSGGAVACGEFVQVHVSADTGRASALPERLRRTIADYEGIALKSSA